MEAENTVTKVVGSLLHGSVVIEGGGGRGRRERERKGEGGEGVGGGVKERGGDGLCRVLEDSPAYTCWDDEDDGPNYGGSPYKFSARALRATPAGCLPKFTATPPKPTKLLNHAIGWHTAHRRHSNSWIRDWSIGCGNRVQSLSQQRSEHVRFVLRSLLRHDYIWFHLSIPARGQGICMFQ